MRYVFFVLLLCASPCNADIRLPRILGSGMVLQRETDVAIWGWAAAGEEVTVTGDWLEEPARIVADLHGNWRLRIETGKAGGPHNITISGATTIRLDDILFGEVWIGSGQSNMEMPLVRVSDAYTGILDSAEEVEQSRFPEIRLFQVGNFSSREPLEDVEYGIEMYGIPPAACRWRPCSPQTVPHIASTAYFFARTLHSELDIPIGIIDSSWGGTSAEVWTPVAGLQKLGYTAELKQASQLPPKASQKSLPGFTTA